MSAAELARLQIIQLAAAGKKVSVELSLADMIGVGMSLRALAKQDMPNAETALIFERVGRAMVAAATGKEPK